MATNEVYDRAENIVLPVPSGTVSGDPVAVGALVGVCETSRDANGNATVRMVGGHTFPTADAVASAGIALYVTSTRTITTTATSNTLFGYSLAAKDTAGNVLIKIHQV